MANMRNDKLLVFLISLLLIGSLVLNQNEEKSEYIITYWGGYIDGQILSQESAWQDYLNVMNQLKEAGATHAGIHIWYVGTDHQKLISRLSQMRDNDLKIALHNSPWFYSIRTCSECMDPQTHSTNGQNLKYFDSLGFDAFNCSTTFRGGYCYLISGEGEHCSILPSRTAVDPAYDGVVWQRELTLLENILNISGITSEDIFLFDAETWGPTEEYFEGCYPDVLTNSVERYSGTITQRYQQYWDYWAARGSDLIQEVKQINTNILTLFYNENIPELEEVYTTMPSGSGDFPSPKFYVLPSLLTLQQKLNEGDFSGSYPWVNMLYREADYESEFLDWDTKITQKAGFMLKQEGVKGVILYPGPMSYSPQRYIGHVSALKLGLVEGIDPGILTEICGDGIDNDGDNQVDEGCY